MQLKPMIESAGWVIAQLALFAGWMGFIVYLILREPINNSKFIGGFVLAIGVLHLLFYKRSGRKFYARTQSLPTYFARFWACGGEMGMQLLFLGFGIILIVAGGVLIVLGPA
jgi:hypothetical protein